MFDISFFEIMIISIVALIIVGPERLPHVARTLGHLMNRCRQFVYSVKTDIHNEIRMEELKNMHNDVQETVHAIENSVRKEIDEIKSTTQTHQATHAIDHGTDKKGAQSKTETMTPSPGPESQQDVQQEGSKPAPPK